MKAHLIKSTNVHCFSLDLECAPWLATEGGEGADGLRCFLLVNGPPLNRKLQIPQASSTPSKAERLFGGFFLDSTGESDRGLARNGDGVAYELWVARELGCGDGAMGSGVGVGPLEDGTDEAHAVGSLSTTSDADVGSSALARRNMIRDGSWEGLMLQQLIL